MLVLFISKLRTQLRKAVVKSFQALIQYLNTLWKQGLNIGEDFIVTINDDLIYQNLIENKKRRRAWFLLST